MKFFASLVAIAAVWAVTPICIGRLHTRPACWSLRTRNKRYFRTRRSRLTTDRSISSRSRISHSMRGCCIEKFIVGTGNRRSLRSISRWAGGRCPIRLCSIGSIFRKACVSSGTNTGTRRRLRKKRSFRTEPICTSFRRRAEIASRCKSLRLGSLFHLSGELVEATGPDIGTWRSSLTRTDSGNGACELVWVEELSPLTREDIDHRVRLVRQ